MDLQEFDFEHRRADEVDFDRLHNNADALLTLLQLRNILLTCHDVGLIVEASFQLRVFHTCKFCDFIVFTYEIPVSIGLSKLGSWK